MEKTLTPSRSVKVINGDERRNEFFFHFYENKFWELTELKREDVNFGAIDLYTLKQQVVEDMNMEINRQISSQQQTQQKALPEYKLKEQVPKWIPRNLAVKSLTVEQEGVKDNIAAQIDANLQAFFQFHPEISKVFGYEIFEKDIKIYFQYHELSLEEDIQQRIQEKRPFQEELLWKMLYNLIRASSLLNETNQSLVDIRPSRIYYNQYQTSVIPYGIFPDQDLSLLDKLLIKQQPVHFAPEQEQEFQLGIPQTTEQFFQNNFKQESYQIGMSILMAGLMLASQNPAYDYQAKSINQLELSNMLAEFARRYSSSDDERLLSYVLDLLLKKDPILRMNSSELLNILQPFQSQIIFLQNPQDFKLKLTQVFNEKFPDYQFYLKTKAGLL